MPIATSTAEPADARRPSHEDTPARNRNATAAPTNTSAAPPNACEPSPASSTPSSVASIARKPSRPTVSAMTKRIQTGGMRRIHGSHSIPSAIGITPT